jgi:hypothetical protein
MLVYLPAILPRSSEHHRGAEITRIADKTAGVADGTGGIRQYFQIILRAEICQGPKPRSRRTITKHPNRLANMIRPRVDIRPKQDCLRL